jgi:hypothetical protein
VLGVPKSEARGLVDLDSDPVIGVGYVGDQEPRPPTAGDRHGNLVLVEPVDPIRLQGTYEAVTAQFPWIGPPWLTECTGCGRKIVTASSWARGLVQCDSWSPGCRDAADWHRWADGNPESEIAGPQSTEWTRQLFPPHDDLRARLAAMRARVASREGSRVPSLEGGSGA